jgi:hypothetical protein
MVKTKVSFIARRREESEVLDAQVSCLLKWETSSVDKAIAAIKAAIIEWGMSTEGNAAILDSCYDFNFGDLALYQDNPNLIKALENNGVFHLTIEIEIKLEVVSFDTILCPPQEEF